ncbi:hypothetical protein KAR91_53415 [Candidatus Pacearchaeota archaeon]|nr:hypothetical protein [Candidatus Pacearchaeota archaeon]
MAQLVNPKIEIKILGGYDITISDARMSARISKDLKENPNEAEIRILNLNRNYQDQIRDAGYNDAPVEIYFTAGGRPSEGLIKAYVGEIDFATSEDTHPGVETFIKAFSQKKNHRSFYFQKTFSKGTPIDEIILEFVSAIGLPRGNDYDLPTNGILLSESFSGAAFDLLARYCFDIGRYTYIIDGKLYITSIFQPPEPVVISLDPKLMLSTPMKKTRHDRTDIEMRAISEDGVKSPFPPEKKRRRRKKKIIEVPGANDYVQFEAVDEAIRGMDFDVMAQPGINPDMVIGENGLYYRIQGIDHDVDNDGGSWKSEIETDEYAEDGGNFLNEISGIQGGGDFFLP